jgi:hypothetical protein
MFIAGQRAAAASIDDQAARDYFADGRGDLSNLGRAATASGWAAGRWVDVWPAAAETQAYQQVRTSALETLVVNGELDISTPPQLAARELMPYLPNGQEVVLPDFGHTGSFFNEQPDAGTHLANTFLDTGRADVSQYQPQSVDFTRPTSHGTYAKITLATLLGLVVLMVLSLIVLARRVGSRERIGPVAAGALRSIYPIMLGLGGWSLAALIVLTTMPGVRITNELVVITSVAVPAGLGIYWAWVHRSWSAATKRAGGAAAGLGALAGAWLGFEAAVVPLALLTAIAGAVAGANLALILLDLWRARRAGPPPAAETVAVRAPAEPIPTPIGMP